MVPHLRAQTGMKTTVVMQVQDILSGNLRLHLRLSEIQIAQIEVIVLAEKVREKKGNNMVDLFTSYYCFFFYIVFRQIHNTQNIHGSSGGWYEQAAYIHEQYRDHMWISEQLWQRKRNSTPKAVLVRLRKSRKDAI